MKKYSFTSLSSVACSVLLFFLCCSCKKDEATPQKIDVYMAGVDDDSQNHNLVYWKNEEKVVLSQLTIDEWPEIGGIALDGNDVYVVANTQGNIPGSKWLIWKNGVQSELTDGTVDTQVNGIKVSNGDVYVVGYTLQGKYYVATYWKNGVKKLLTDGTRASFAYDISLSGSNVYISGIEQNPDQSYNMLYWKNETPSVLLRTGENGLYYSIAASNEDVYVYGLRYVYGPNNENILTYWKNGIANVVTTNENNTDFPENHSIVIDGTDIYVAEARHKNGKKVISVWKNGTESLYSWDSGDVELNQISVTKGNVYVLGYYIDNNGHLHSLLWVNGKLMPILNSLQNTHPYAIATRLP